MLAEFDPTLVGDFFEASPVALKSPSATQRLHKGQSSSQKCLACAAYPTLRVLKDTVQQYARASRLETDLSGLQFPHTLGVIHTMFYPERTERVDHPICASSESFSRCQTTRLAQHPAFDGGFSGRITD